MMRPIRTQRIIAWSLQALSAALLVILPIWWPEKIALAKTPPYLWTGGLEAAHLNYAALLILISPLVLIISQAADKVLMTREVKGVVSDRDFLQAYAEAIESCIAAAHASTEMNANQLTHARRQVLRAICLVVHYYYDKSDTLDINACYMLAYSVAEAPNGIESRLRFKDRNRDMNTYAYILDLVMWAEYHGDLPKEIALPVEDTNRTGALDRLLPGAPASFATDRVCVVEDTRNLESYFSNEGKFVDREVVAEQLEFFRKQRFRSFASFPLSHNREPKGVLNLQSRKPRIFGRNNDHQEVVTKLLNPLKAVLCALI